MEYLLDPLVIECFLVVCLTIAGIVVARRLRRIAQRLDSITALGDFIAGLNDYFRGDYAQGVDRLEKAVAADPKNVEARIALGDCYRELGDLAEAHKHHTHVRTTFGVDEVENLRSLAQDHELRGDLNAAADCMKEVQRRLPGDLETARALQRLLVATGDFIGAITAQEAVVSILSRSPEAEALRAEETRELARLHALAGEQLLDRGDPRGARSYLEHAVRMAPDLVGARMNLVRAAMELGEADEARVLFGQQLEQIAELASSGDQRLELVSAGASRASAARLLGAPVEATILTTPAVGAEGGSGLPLLPAPRTGQEASALVAQAGGQSGTGMREFLVAVLPRVAAIRCSDCGHCTPEWEELCPVCDAPGTLYSVYTHERRPVPELVEIVREATGGAEHQLALLARVSRGDDRAAGKLADLGESAVDNVIGELPTMRNPQRGLEVLIEMGTASFGPILDAYARLESQEIAATLGKKISGFGSYEDAITYVARGLGADVLPILYERLGRSQSTLASLACRISVTLGDAQGLESHRHLFDARMLVTEIRLLGTAEVVRLLAATSPQSCLVDDVFIDPSWKGDAALAEAAKHPECTQVVLAILRRRGVTGKFITPALSLLQDTSYARILLELMDELGDDPFLQLLPGATDAGVPESVRARLADRLAERLAADPTLLVEHLGGATLAAENELREAIARCGEAALPALQSTFEARRGRLLGTLRPFARKQDREVRIALAAAIGECVRTGVPGARDLAVKLQGGEEETDVQRALDRAAHQGGER